MRHLVLQGDCLELAGRLSLPVALIVTSPPYNANMPYGAGFDDRKPGIHYLEFLRRFLAVADSVLSPGGWLVLNLRDPKLPHRRVSALAFVEERLPGYEHAATVRWEKRLDFDEEAYRNDRLPGDGFEPIFFFRKPGPRRAPLAVEPTWRLVPPSKVERGEHPCPFPVELPARVIEACTAPGEWVLDPFGGSGTTALAAARAGRSSVSIELNPGFCELAVARLRGERVTVERGVPA